MQFESRETRKIWTGAVLGLLPDAAIGALIGAGREGGAVIGAVLGVVAFQFVYLLLWLKRSAWSWLVFWLGGRAQLCEHYLSFLRSGGFPPPNSREASAQANLDAICRNEQLAAQTRLLAAEALGALSVRPLLGGFQYNLQTSIALEDAIAKYRSEVLARQQRAL